MASEEKTPLQLFYETDDACPREFLATLKDFASAVIYIVGAYVTNTLLRQLFPEDMPLDGRIVIAVNNLTFLVLTLRIFVNEARCLLKDIARTAYENQLYTRTIWRREEHEAKQPEKQNPVSRTKSRRNRKSGKRR